LLSEDTISIKAETKIELMCEDSILELTPVEIHGKATDVKMNVEESEEEIREANQDVNHGSEGHWGLEPH